MNKTCDPIFDAKAKELHALLETLRKEQPELFCEVTPSVMEYVWRVIYGIGEFGFQMANALTPAIERVSKVFAEFSEVFHE